MRYKKKLLTVMALVLAFSTVGASVVSAKDCYKKWYKYVNCVSCDDSQYDSSQTDTCSGKHPRQYGIKLCSTHLKEMSTKASFYKRGYSDYNCLAYALGKNGVQSWLWPAEWGDAGPSLAAFKKYIENKGYTCTTSASAATGKEVIYAYSKNGHVVHFSRKYTLDGKAVSGAATLSKWGSMSLYKTTIIDPYASTSIYGYLAFICYK